MRISPLLKDILYLIPYPLAFLLVAVFYTSGVLSAIQALALGSIVLLFALLSAFFRYSSMGLLLFVIILSIPFFVIEFALIYADLGIISANGVKPDALDYLYFSVVTFTTLGYGDFQPTEAARLFAAVEALVGYVVLGVFVSVLIVVAQRHENRRATRSAIRRKALLRHDPLELKARVTRREKTSGDE